MSNKVQQRCSDLVLRAHAGDERLPEDRQGASLGPRSACSTDSSDRRSTPSTPSRTPLSSFGTRKAANLKAEVNSLNSPNPSSPSSKNRRKRATRRRRSSHLHLHCNLPLSRGSGERRRSRGGECHALATTLDLENSSGTLLSLYSRTLYRFSKL